MKGPLSLLTGYIGLVCRVFAVTPDSFSRGRRGNLPPPQGADQPVSFI